MTDSLNYPASGTLLAMIKQRSQKALAQGVLIPIETRVEIIEQAGIRFQIRWVSSLKRKKEAGKTSEKRPGNPFLPPEPELTVCAFGENHIGVLNKFNVIENHLLIITRQFEPQTSLLTQQDLGALWSALGEFPSLGFYNGGREAGASQPHKHLQLIPLPLLADEPDTPISPLIEKAPSSSTPSTFKGLEHNHAWIRLHGIEALDQQRGTAYLETCYRQLLGSIGVHALDTEQGQDQSSPYNLLMTRDWMMAVPRSAEHWNGISLNALAYAGSLFVPEREMIERIATAGPLELLRATT
jgi:ATP adenylyltransferase